MRDTQFCNQIKIWIKLAKDGDLVEVDANKGVVKKLNR